MDLSFQDYLQDVSGEESALVEAQEGQSALFHADEGDFGDSDDASGLTDDDLFANEDAQVEQDFLQNENLQDASNLQLTDSLTQGQQNKDAPTTTDNATDGQRAHTASFLAGTLVALFSSYTLSQSETWLCHIVAIRSD